MQDVAQVMGVSTTTVSNAFSRPDQLSTELRDRILTRAAKMGYYGPHVAGRILRQGHANAYGVVFMDPLQSAFDDQFKIQWLAGFSDELRTAQASLVLMTVPATQQASATALRNTLVDGIAVTWSSHPIMSMARSQGLPVVAGGPHGPCYVTIDEHAAGTAIAAHLRERGHDHVCLITGPVAHQHPTPVTMTWADYLAAERPNGPWARTQGIVNGLGPCPPTVAQATSWGRAAGAAAAAAALDAWPNTTALACVGDPLAIGALDELNRRHLSPGVDIAVTGFDGIPDTEERDLTTIDAYARDQGTHTARLLVDPNCQPRQLILGHELIHRASS